MAESVRESITNAIDGKGNAVDKWKGMFAEYDRKYSTWASRVDRIIKRYRDENRDKSKDGGAAKFNILWANVQTLRPAVYSRVPKPDVSRRFRDNDPIGRVAALILERGLEFEVEHYPDFRHGMDAAVLDRFLGGRGTVWVRYEPHIRRIEGADGEGEKTELNPHGESAQGDVLPEDGLSVTEDIDSPEEELDYECTPVDYVHWKDFGHNVCRTWEEVTTVWRKVYMTRQQCIERFGEELGSKIPLDVVPEELRKGQMGGGENSDMSRALIYEVWNKPTLKVTWLCDSMKEVLDEKDDPYGLEGFFPCPKPLYATLTNESLEPVPDFSLYQDQAKELDTLADRAQGLINSLQVKGVYDASIQELARIFTEGDNGTLIPVKNWAAFAEKNGLRGAIETVDLKPIYEALRVCFDATDRVLQQIYNLTGISDIIRGESNANETATAQTIKGQYASLRLKSMQQAVATFASEIFQIKAQIICGKYAPETILKMAAVQEMNPIDQQMVPQAIALLIGPERAQDPLEGAQGKNPMRSFRVEVNADTMVQINEEEEKKSRMEFISAMGAFMEKALPMAQASVELRPLILELWKYSVAAYKSGKTIEGAFDSAIDAMKQQAANPQQQKPDPEIERVKADAAMQQQRAQADMQVQQMKIQSDAALKQMEMRMDMQQRQMEATIEMQFEKWKAMLQAQTQLKTAEMAAAHQGNVQ